MNLKLAEYFEEELTHVRRMAEEFKHANPQVAARLQLGQDPPDPYVQMLLDGFAYLTARIHLKLDSEFPRFSEALLQTIFPHYLAPVPSMAVVAFEPEWANAELGTGPVVPRGTVLSTVLMPGDSVRCSYTTAHDLQVLPVRLLEAKYFAHDLAEVNSKPNRDGSSGWVEQTGASAAVRMRLELTAGLKFSQLETDKLVLHLRPSENLAGILFEQLLAHTTAVVIQTANRPARTLSILSPAPVRPVGFEENEALLPPSARSYSGYRVLQEYFAFTSRFLFIEVSRLRPAFAASQDSALDLIFCLKDQEPRLERRVQSDCFALHCVPAVNLFPMDNLIVDIKDEREEHLIVPDRVKTLEYEVYSVQRLVGRPKGSNKPDERYEFHPFYFSPDKEVPAAGFFSTRRTRRNLTDQEIRHSPVSDYLGSDVYLSLAGPALRDTLGKLSALHVSALCTNRHVTMRRAELNFDLGIGAPVTSIKTIAKSAPRPSHLEGRVLWRVISHLALNYRSLLSGDQELGAAAVQELLRLYIAEDHDLKNAQVRALKAASAEPIFRRVESLGPIAYARGLKVRLEFDETPFSESGVFLFGAVLDRFLSRYVTMNSFVQTELATRQRGSIHTWPIAKGMRQML